MHGDASTLQFYKIQFFLIHCLVPFRQFLNLYAHFSCSNDFVRGLHAPDSWLASHTFSTIVQKGPEFKQFKTLQYFANSHLRERAILSLTTLPFLYKQHQRMSFQMFILLTSLCGMQVLLAGTYHRWIACARIWLIWIFWVGCGTDESLPPLWVEAIW